MPLNSDLLARIRTRLEEPADPLDRYKVFHPKLLALTTRKRVLFTFLGSLQPNGYVFIDYKGETFLLYLHSHHVLMHALRRHLEAKFKDDPEREKKLDRVAVECDVYERPNGALQTRYHLYEV